MGSTLHILCNQGIAKSRPNPDHQCRVGQRGMSENHTVREPPIPSAITSIFTPVAVPWRISSFFCKKYLHALTVIGQKT
jgi:hypothetical protein